MNKTWAIRVSEETNGDRWKYTGRELDSETGLQFNRARYYNPTDGRWTGQDPLGFGGADGNLYRYVDNAPTIATDPDGLAPKLSINSWAPARRGNFGAFAWGIDWSVTQECNKGGVIIQHLQVDWDITRANGRKFIPAVLDDLHNKTPGNGNMPNHFEWWEAWIVKANSNSPEEQAPFPYDRDRFRQDGVRDIPVAPANDWYALPAADRRLNGTKRGIRTSGNELMLGYVTFWEGMTEKDLQNMGFQKGNPNTGAGAILYSLEADPAGTNGDFLDWYLESGVSSGAFLESNEVRHILRADWNANTNNGKTEVQTNP